MGRIVLCWLRRAHVEVVFNIQQIVFLYIVSFFLCCMLLFGISLTIFAQCIIVLLKFYCLLVDISSLRDTEVSRDKVQKERAEVNEAVLQAPRSLLQPWGDGAGPARAPNPPHRQPCAPALPEEGRASPRARPGTEGCPHAAAR